MFINKSCVLRQINNKCTVVTICNECGEYCIGGKCQHEESDSEVESERARQEFVESQRQQGSMLHQDMDELRDEKEKADMQRVKHEEHPYNKMYHTGYSVHPHRAQQSPKERSDMRKVKSEEIKERIKCKSEKKRGQRSPASQHAASAHRFVIPRYPGKQLCVHLSIRVRGADTIYKY